MNVVRHNRVKSAKQCSVKSGKRCSYHDSTKQCSFKNSHEQLQSKGLDNNHSSGSVGSKRNYRTSEKCSGHPNNAKAQRSKLDKGAASGSENEVNIAASFHRNVLLLQICEKKLPALIDSGASVSCIQKSLVDKLQESNNLNMYSSCLSQVTGVGGEKHGVIGAVKLPVKISGLIFEQEFIIIRELHHPVILGIDFMSHNKCALDFQYNVLTFTTAEVSVALTPDSKHGYARCTRPETIPANSEVNVTVRVSKGHKNETLLLDPAGNLQGTNIVGARCIVTTRNIKAVMRLANPTNEAVYLSPTGILANVHLMIVKFMHLETVILKQTQPLFQMLIYIVRLNALLNF